MSDSPTRHTPSSKVLELPHARRNEAPHGVTGTSAADDEKLFRLQLQLDVERERELLYKVILVILTITSLLLAREWALWLLG